MISGCRWVKAIGIEVPVAGVAGDQQAALFGQGCWRGRARQEHVRHRGPSCSSTLARIRWPARTDSSQQLRVTKPAGPAFALEGSIFIAGAAVQWLRDGLQVIDAAPESEAMARSVDGNDGVYFVPSFVGMGAPHWQAEARGTVVGLTRGTRREHLVRAALEAMAYATHGRAPRSGSRLGRGSDGAACGRGCEHQRFPDGVPGGRARHPGAPPGDGGYHRARGGRASRPGDGGVAGTLRIFWPPERIPLCSPPGMQAAERQVLLAGWARAVRATKAWAEDQG